MLHIDGSYGEGGGQILRTAVAFSVLTKTPVEITDIRVNRPNPGIKPQHYTAIKILGELCNAKTDGLDIGSSSLTFVPGEITGGKYSFDIGTAGSIILVFQACLLCSVKTKIPITLKVTGGTDVKWSPSWDYFKYVFLPLLKKMGLPIDAHLVRRGYYPRGGGEIILSIQPCNDVRPLRLGGTQEFTMVDGIINIANLPDHISKRMKDVITQTLSKKNLDVSLKIEKAASLSAGTGVTLWAESHDAILGATVLGERGLSAERVGERVAAEIICEIESGATLDIHAFDQILPYMAVVRSGEWSSCIVREISSHAQTNMWLISRFFKDQDMFVIEDKGDLKLIKVRGTKYL